MKTFNIQKIYKNTLLLALTAMMLTILAGCASGPRTVEVPDTRADYVLGIGDKLRINVFGQEELTGEYTVESNGDISFPLLGDVPVAGFTPTEIEAKIADDLDPDYIVSPRVSIEVLNYRSLYVLGEVQQPGKYEYAPNLTVLQAIATAGGYTYRANEDTVEVTRHVKGALKTFTVNQTTMLKPGDTIVVKRRWF
ncbi:MAG: polysaccharide biosynthesis protein [Micavibrio aeruginosavorus]|uniref:Polysaccharide biosynthesis protein n=1 Tax=Micavibrio aeruginosavorus TaxID=349221 RepID=A0A2W5MWF2_9BACT|nr:MAG: polysaccharide biosynthesis protein [Micavibrio aeruginosavorus]